MRKLIPKNITILIKLNKAYSNDIEFLNGILSFLSPLLKDSNNSVRKATSLEIIEIASFTADIQLAKDAIETLIPLFKEEVEISLKKICANRDIQFAKDIIDNYLIPFLKDSDGNTTKLVSSTVVEIINQKSDLMNQDVLSQTLIPLLKESERNIKRSALYDITTLLRNNYKKADANLLKYVLENFAPLLQDPDDQISESASSNIIELTYLIASNNLQLVSETINLLSPFFQYSNSNAAKNALEILKKLFYRSLGHPESFAQYLTHSSKNMRDAVIDFLLPCFQEYLNEIQILDQLFQLPFSDLTLDIVIEKFSHGLFSRESLQSYLDERQEKQLQLYLGSEIICLENLDGPRRIELAFAIIGQETVSKNDLNHQKLIELAKEALNIQLKYLHWKSLNWIDKNFEKLLSLSVEAKVFCKNIYHKLLENGEITSLEERLFIKFINQGLTTSLTKDKEIIFEGKRYKLKGDDIDLLLESIAKTVIDQQQDILATQYKKHEPIFKISSSLKGGMKQAASDIKEIRSIVDSRHALEIETWLLTRLKSLILFPSQISRRDLNRKNTHGILHVDFQSCFPKNFDSYRITSQFSPPRN